MIRILSLSLGFALSLGACKTTSSDLSVAGAGGTAACERTAEVKSIKELYRNTESFARIANQYAELRGASLATMLATFKCAQSKWCSRATLSFGGSVTNTEGLITIANEQQLMNEMKTEAKRAGFTLGPELRISEARTVLAENNTSIKTTDKTNMANNLKAEATANLLVSHLFEGANQTEAAAELLNTSASYLSEAQNQGANVTASLKNLTTNIRASYEAQQTNAVNSRSGSSSQQLQEQSARNAATLGIIAAADTSGETGAATELATLVKSPSKAKVYIAVEHIILGKSNTNQAYNEIAEVVRGIKVENGKVVSETSIRTRLAESYRKAGLTEIEAKGFSESTVRRAQTRFQMRL